MFNSDNFVHHNESLRNTLLPKRLRGELRPPVAAKLMEDRA
jgi:hypothetical protein